MMSNTDAQVIQSTPQQRILFGSPGTGKSHKVHTEYLQDVKSENIIKTVFHPEYKYGDFMGRLIPLTDEKGSVRYEYQAGHFLRVLACAYKNILDNKSNPAPVGLIIDEINRGNSSAIFGTVFQILDRDNNGWSSYEVDLSSIELDCLMKLMGLTKTITQAGNTVAITYRNSSGNDFNGLGIDNKLVKNGKIKLPPNLSIFATMNTSDESIYYMDAAFKRRWDWEFVPVNGGLTKKEGNAFSDETAWKIFVGNLNGFIKKNSSHIRKVEDKLIGHYFLKAPYSYDKIQSKLMFFLWDSVFTHNKEPLNTLLELKDTNKLLTFGDFANQVAGFVTKIKSRS